MLILDNVTFKYDDQPTTYTFSLTAKAGEITSISGVSGSGKSTLLDLIAGFQKPQSGQFKLDDVALQDLSAQERPVAILFQDNNLFGHLSAERNLKLALPNTKKHDGATRVKNALSAVGLEGFAHHIADQLSGGQKQRVALARTLLLARPILLLDEPFSALDTKTAQEMRQLVKQLVQSEGWCAILVTHHEQDHAIADKKITLENGAFVTSS